MKPNENRNILNISTEDPLAVAVVGAIHKGDVESLKHLLADNPGLARARLGDPNECKGMSRSLLHVATDWPGHFPNGAATVAALIAAGADIEAPGAVIGGGTPLADAVAFGQWKAARRLVERGARTALWQAAALGLIDRVEKHFAGDGQSALAPWLPRPPRPDVPPPNEITHAFWCACHGSQREAAEFLLARGADLNWIGYDGLTPIDAARRSEAGALVEWLA